MEQGMTMDQAFAEASRCLLCHEGPCSAGCPASTEPDRFIRKLRFRNLKGAIAVIKENNILGGVCAVVCPTCTLCAQSCVASGIAEPIRIGELQRFLIEYGWEIGFTPITPKPSIGKKVAVIGSGPAGLTCAAEIAKEGGQAVIFEKLDKPGGMLGHAIPEHRLSQEFLQREIADIEALGVEIRCHAPIATQEDLNALFDDGFDAVFVATGTWHSLGLPGGGQASQHTYKAMDFLRLAKGQPDEFKALVKDKEIAVIGGGDTAMDSAVSAVKSGAGSVAILYRRSMVEMPGSVEERKLAMESGVHFLILTQPIDYAMEGSTFQGVRVIRTRLGEPDQSGRRSPEPVGGSEHIVAADIVVEAIGLTPLADISDLSGLTFDSKLRMVVGPDGCSTNLDNVYAGGDSVRGPSIVAQAVADGKRAAAKILDGWRADQ
jgi:glutamate synthase (NADPH) small chain